MHLERNDKFFIAICLVLFCIVSWVDWPSWRSSALILSLGLVFAIILTSQIESYRRSQLQYRHIQSLFSLFSLLKINAPLPLMAGWAVPPDFAAAIVSLVLECKPRRVLELGSGTSTVITAYALKTAGEGTVISLEQKPSFAVRSEENIRKHKLQDIAAIKIAPLKETSLQGQTWRWYDKAALAGIDDIDLLIVDGPTKEGSCQRMHRYPALPVLLPLLSANAVVLIDDAHRRDVKEMVKRWRAEFPTFAYEAVDSEQGIVIFRRQTSEAVHKDPA